MISLLVLTLQHGVPTVYSGDLKNDDTVLGWITKELRETGIKEVNPEVLNSILERLDYVAVVYYDKTRKADLVKIYVTRFSSIQNCGISEIVL